VYLGTNIELINLEKEGDWFVEAGRQGGEKKNKNLNTDFEESKSGDLLLKVRIQSEKIR